MGVDPHSREHIFDIVRQLRSQGTAILYTTHYMEEAEALCDRLGIMDEGHIIATGTLQDAAHRSRLRRGRRGARPALSGRAAPPAGASGRVPHGDAARTSRGCTSSRPAHLLAPLQQALGSQVQNVSVHIAPAQPGESVPAAHRQEAARLNRMRVDSRVCGRACGWPSWPWLHAAAGDARSLHRPRGHAPDPGEGARHRRQRPHAQPAARRPARAAQGLPRHRHHGPGRAGRPLEAASARRSRRSS